MDWQQVIFEIEREEELYEAFLRGLDAGMKVMVEEDSFDEERFREFARDEFERMVLD